MIKDILQDLVLHNISKDEAETRIKDLFNSLKAVSCIEFEVDERGTFSHSSGCYLKLTNKTNDSILTYIKNGSKVNIMVSL